MPVAILPRAEVIGAEHVAGQDANPSVRTFSIGIMSLQKRANRLVRDAAEQLLPYADSGHPMIIVLDNYCQKGISLYNPDAAVPLPRDVFNDPDDEHLN